MNTTEKVVESYFRLCRGCFTMADVKVINGNNRQIDLLAFDPKTGNQYHVESSVTHQENWCPKPKELFSKFDKKFFGVPPKRKGRNTDYARGKRYKEQIDKTYKSVGLNPGKIKRIWVCWTVVEADDLDQKLAAYCKQRCPQKLAIEIISFRDVVIPELEKRVKTANYDDDVLRMLSLLQQVKKQPPRRR